MGFRRSRLEIEADEERRRIEGFSVANGTAHDLVRMEGREVFDVQGLSPTNRKFGLRELNTALSCGGFPSVQSPNFNDQDVKDAQALVRNVRAHCEKLNLPIDLRTREMTQELPQATDDVSEVRGFFQRRREAANKNKK